MTIAAFEEFALELVYHQSSLAGIQIVTSDDALFSHLQYLSDRTRKLLLDIRLRLSQLKKEKVIASAHVDPPSTFVGPFVGGSNAPAYGDGVEGPTWYTSRRRGVARRKPDARA
ncbi:hypothetical protein ZOSMA_105G00350 [Zostera marina]|uniref:Uncharacterized protein n=1 Tax=Zostera marina TaxID=29655 RepID=A0A0K9Q655_ZOSMR|nr:hypothetical protein ZOSMA_105G00350 [Zostera marina]